MKAFTTGKLFWIVVICMTCLVSGTGELQAQEPQHKILNFDKIVDYHNADLYIAPPLGKTWTIVSGSLAIMRPVRGLSVTIFKQYGDSPNHLRDSIIRADLSTTAWVPIVGGYVAHPQWGYLRGQDAPIVIQHPHKLVIHFGALNETVSSFTRVTVIESESPYTPRP